MRVEGAGSSRLAHTTIGVHDLPQRHVRYGASDGGPARVGTLGSNADCCSTSTDLLVSDRIQTSEPLAIVVTKH